MMVVALLVVVASLLVVPPAWAAPSATGCLRASGTTGNRCLAKYTQVVEKCRKKQDAACEDAARADGGTLAGVLAKNARPIAKQCDDASGEGLGYIDAADVGLRIDEACVDFGEDALARAAGSGSADGAFLKCRKAVVSQLRKVRAKTIQLFGPGCGVKEFRGKTCKRDKRDARHRTLLDKATGRIAKKCPTGFAGMPIGDLVETEGTRARHYALRVFPPNNLGPSADFGPFPVGIRTLMLADDSRMNVPGDGPRPVTTEVYYPSTDAAVAGLPRDVVTILGVPITETPAYRDVDVAPGTFPLVVFSHGNGGIRIQSFFFAAHLASHGYVVASPDHHGNTFLDVGAGVIDPASAANRPRDMSFVIDEMLALTADAGSFLPGAIDPETIGASGHSFGGFTTFALVGDDGFPGIPADPRVDAAFPQAPAAPFAEAFYDGVTVPTLIVGGSIDGTTPFPTDQQRPYDLLSPGAAIVGLAEIENGGHFTFSDFCEVDRELLAFLGGFEEACEPRHLPWRHAHDIVNYLGLNFFDAILKTDAAALGRLDVDVVNAIDDVRFERK
jgi:predicted dienelactone hydrolase